ncbi:MAG: hypothetical protein AAGG51_30755 [Cyanobacteria bacterium P01_G01_bin.54]
MPFAVLLRLFFSLWITYLWHFQPWGLGSDRLVFLVQAIAEQGTFALDNYTVLLPPGQGVVVQGHLYSDLNPGLALLAAPFWWLVSQVYLLLPETSLWRQPDLHYVLSHGIAVGMTTSLLTAITACGLAQLVYHKTQMCWRGVLAALLYGGGSVACFFATHLNPHGAIAAIVLGLYITLFTPELLGLGNHRYRAAAIGFLLGAGLLIDITMLPMVAVTAGFLVVQYRDRLQELFGVMLGAIPPLTLLLYYQAVCFGHPLSTALGLWLAQTHQSSWAGQVGQQGFKVSALGVYLFSPCRGLLIYQPYLVLVVAYLVLFWVRSRRLQAIEKQFIASTSLVYLALLTVIPADTLVSAFGPQQLLPLLPLLCMVVAVYCPQPLNGGTLWLFGLGFGFNLIGAQQGTMTENVLRSSLLALSELPSFPFITWLATMLPQRVGMAVGGRWELVALSLWLVSLGLIWRPMKPKSRRRK